MGKAAETAQALALRSRITLACADGSRTSSLPMSWASQSTVSRIWRLGITQAEVAQRTGVTQGRVSAIEHAKPGATVQGVVGRRRRGEARLGQVADQKRTRQLNHLSEDQLVALAEPAISQYLTPSSQPPR